MPEHVMIYEFYSILERDLWNEIHKVNPFKKVWSGEFYRN